MNNVFQIPESPLVVLGGFVSEVNNPSLPLGSAAVATDCDFSVASVRTRDGIQNVYSYAGAFDAAFVSAGISVSLNPLETAWVNPSNIVHHTPGTYAVVNLNNSGSGGSAPSFDVGNTAQSANAANSNLSVSLTPTSVFNEFAIFVAAIGPAITSGPAGYTVQSAGNLNSNGNIYFNNITATTTPTVSYGSGFCSPGATLPACALGALFFAPNGAPNVLHQYTSPLNANLAAGTNTITLGTATTAGNALVFVGMFFQCGDQPVTFSNVADPQNDNFQSIETVTENTVSGGNGGSSTLCLFVASNIAGGTTSVTFSLAGPATSCQIARYWLAEVQNVGALAATNSTSTLLEASAAPLAVPTNSQITGVQVIVSGKQNSSDPNATLSIAPLTLNNAAVPKTFQLPLSDGSVTLGSPIDEWSQYWTPPQVNNPAFGFSIQASVADSTQVTFSVSGVELIVWYTPPGLTQFDYVKTFAMTDGETLTLALDNTGVFWQEDAINNPNVLTPFFTAIEPNTFAVSVTEDDHEYIALSNLQNGTDMPRQYNGQWVDRISQVGPAIGPQITATSNQYPISTITQASAETLGDGTKNYTVTWTANFGSIGPAGNILSFEAKPGFFADILAAGVGASIIIAGVQTINGQNPNNGQGNVPAVYQVIAVGTVNTAFWGANTPYFSVLATSTNHADLIVQNGATYQLTLATVTTTTTVPNLQVGSQMTIAGSSIATYDNTWTVTGTPNASQLNITQTSLSGGVATYAFTIITGSAPTPGQQVTVTDTSNGNGIFNVSNQVITSATASTFSINIVSPDIPPAAETGNGIVNGTIFQFDPMESVGSATGGNIVIAGGLGAGTRGVVVLFKTRNGAITPASPQTIFTLNATSNAITVTGIPIGPPNVVARIIAFTGANGATQTGGGGFYYWIEEPETLIVNGQKVTYSSTIVNDNVTTQATFNFTDSQLLNATGISVDGNNLFATLELGSCLGFIVYGNRLFAWGEQNKINNLLNYSFDGGVGQTTGVTITTYPLGWTIDPVNGSGGSIVTSPQFGDAYLISNTSGSTQAIWGMITQQAYQDSFGTPIIFSATTYSARVTASCPSGAASGNLVLDLFSPSTSTIWGSFSMPLVSMPSTMVINTGTLLTTAFGIVPSDILIRLYATNIPNNTNIEIDRIEPFPTNTPVLTNQLRGSYEGNFEAFDGVTGNLGATQNQQPIRNAFELFDNLYIVKTGSMFTTVDNGTTEPNFWNVKSVSYKCGTPSIHGVDIGEGWALILGEPGFFVFTGGQPVKISPELDGSDPLNKGFWQSINWKYGYTTWVRNDPNNSKIYIGIPIATPNKWMPNFPANANPTQPNVLLVLNYKELMTAGELIGEGPIRLSYTGELKTYSFGRKWSAWSIQACYGDLVTRADTTTPLFLCGDFGTGKIYQQMTGVFNDDGAAEKWNYITYGFPKVGDAQALGMGLHNLIAEFMTLTTIGSGNLQMIVFPNSLDSPDAAQLVPEPLSNPSACGDLEIPINMAGNRFFVGFQTYNANEWCELSKVILSIIEDPWAPVRGSNN